MLDRYQYLEKLYLHTNSPDGMADLHRRIVRDRTPARLRIVRSKRDARAAASAGSSSEVLVLAIGMISGFGALALAAYHLGF